MACHSTFHFTLLKKAWLPQPIKMMSERRLFGQKYIFSDCSRYHVRLMY